VPASPGGISTEQISFGCQFDPRLGGLVLRRTAHPVPFAAFLGKGVAAMPVIDGRCSRFEDRQLGDLMNIVTKSALATFGLALVASSLPAHAVVATHELMSNPASKCQAFTPGPANTIRNRVVGAENVGAKMNVACSFDMLTNDVYSSSAPIALTVYFSNNGTASITVTCTLLTGYQGESGTYMVTKTTAPIAPGGVEQQSLQWTSTDNPEQGATDLGNLLVGINCSLPTGAVINDSYLAWNQDNGVGD
jgi:hypothetical protein